MPRTKPQAAANYSSLCQLISANRLFAPDNSLPEIDVFLAALVADHGCLTVEAYQPEGKFSNGIPIGTTATLILNDSNFVEKLQHLSSD